MPAAAGGDEGVGSAGLCPEASRIEADMTGLEDDKNARIACAREYAACGRRHGEEGRLEEAEECLERAVRMHGVWAQCSDLCGRIAARLEGGGGTADAVVWYGKAVRYADGEEGGAGAPRDAQREKKRRKRRSKWASECIRCWDALVGGAPQLAPGAELDGPYRAAELAAGGDGKRRADLRVQMGDIEMGRGRCGRAAEWYGGALEIDPGSERAALGAGRALEQDGQWALASSQYERAANAIPRLRKECAAGRARCAQALGSAGSPGEALSALESAAELDASHALECARMHHGRGDALARPEREEGGGGDGAAAGGRSPAGDAATAASASAHYASAVEWYRRAAKAGGGAGRTAAEAARGCARCSRELDRMGMAAEALSALEAAADLDASHALKCARMHGRMADALAGRRVRGARGRSGACDASKADPAAGCRREDDASASASAHYASAVEWYRRAAKAGGGAGRTAAEAARGCARCSRELDRMGMAAEALSALEAAADLDASHALKCARMHGRMADALAGRRVRGARGRSGACDASKADPAAGCRREDDASASASAHYASAVEWYRRAAKAGGGAGRTAAEAARGCARCSRELDRMGMAAEALSALESAAEIDSGAYALECGARCMMLADGLAGDGADASRETKKMHNRALAQYKAAAAAGGPGAQRALLGSAAVRMRLGQYDAAAEAFGAAHSLKGGTGSADLRAECVDGICECACMLAVAGDSGGVGRCLELKILAGARNRKKFAQRCSAQGRAEQEAGRHKEAASCFAAALSIGGGTGGGDDAAVRLCLADSLASLGRHDEAIEQCKAIEERGGRHAIKAVFLLAAMHEAAGRIPEASKCLARAAEADPARAADCAQRCSAMGRAEQEAGRHKEAASCFAAALSIGGGAGGGNDAAVRLALADSLASLGRHDEAIGHYRTAAERAGGGDDAAKALMHMADSLASLGRHDEAIGHYRTAAERAGGGDDAAKALMHMADSLASLGRHDEAIGQYEAAAERAGGGDDAARALSCMAAMHGAAGRIPEASKCLARAAEADPARAADCAQRCSAMGRAEQEAGRHEGAASCFAAALSIGGSGVDDAAVRLALADSHRLAGSSADALREYSDVRRSGDAGQRARAYAGLARILAAGSRHVDAAVLACMAAKAADDAPDGAGRAECSAICAECGDAMQRQGLHDGAYACYAMALSIDPGNAGANCGIGEHMARRGLFMDALVRYEAALEEDGDAARALVGAGTALCGLAAGAPPSGESTYGYDDAERMYERALEIDPENFLAHMGAGRACLGQKAEGLENAVSHYCNAATLRPDDRDARMGAGEALRALARFHADRGRPKKAPECYKRAIKHYERAISSSGPRGMLAPGYWKGVCMLHLERDEKKARAFLRDVLGRARPGGSADHDLCGKICDILGEYERACAHYAESAKGSPLYADGFYGAIDRGRIQAGTMAPARGGETGTDGGGAYAASGEPGAGGAQAAYVLDANVIIDCAGDPAPNMDPDVVGAIVRGIRDGDCRLPQAAFDEAYGIMKGRDGGDLGAVLRDWGADLESMGDRRRADQCMKRARGALMTAWLYSSEETKKRWRTRKFGRGRAPYAGGPPAGRDVEILATAAHLADADGAAGTRRVVLVTSDSDFLDFTYHIREALSIDVERPDYAAGLIARAAREREVREGQDGGRRGAA